MYRRCGVPMSDDLLTAVARMDPAARKRALDVIDEMEAEGRRTMQLMPAATDLARWLHGHEIPMAIVTRNTVCMYVCMYVFTRILRPN
jgi:phosphoglycolate phosphatase-like HAD superfamily hydrolase